MQDFVRIGGEIVSGPLNENFRKLANSISISNVNLIFSEENGVVNTIYDMEAIQSPENGQACYVVSSGELYRYNKKEHEWLKIADFGQTFRQGFLNSGAVVLEDYVKLKDGSTSILSMPSMLVYFKNKEGDERYLKGMYLIPAKEVDFSDKIESAMAYSITVNEKGEYDIITGLPKEDNPNKVYIGTFLTNDKKKITREFIYTLPDMAYTADRGNFLINGGQASGLTLYAHKDGGKKVSRKSGFYYDEGINFSIGQTENFPVDNDNGSNYDLKGFEAEELTDELIYLTPEKSLENDIIITPELIINKYWNGKELVSVPEGMATIQHHLVTPNGQNIILYGNKYYNSFADAVMNLNSVGALELNFPFVEATRIVVVNTPGFTTGSDRLCNFYALTRLAQVGTISPVFSDAAFELYSGDGRDNSPSRLRFTLNELQEDKFEGLFTVAIPKYKANRFGYSLDYKFKSQDYPEIIEVVEDDTIPLREYIANAGFVVGDAQDIIDIHNRVANIEEEIWENYRDNKDIYDQSIRYRLDQIESNVKDNTNDININKTNIENLFKQKVDKATVINEYVLGEENDIAARTITLRTGDIEEGYKQNDPKTGIRYEWYTNKKVSDHPEVKAAYEHSTIKSEDNNANSHTLVNPHNLSTDDLVVLSDTNRMFLTTDEKERIDLKKLPADTWKEIRELQAADANLDAKKIEHVVISTLNRDNSEVSHIGNAKELRFITDGAVVTASSDGSIATVECVGQHHGLMKESIYATKALANPKEYSGCVDRAYETLYARDIHGIEAAGPNQYYGKDKNGNRGLHDLPTYVSSRQLGEEFDNVDEGFMIPKAGSVSEDSLTTDLKNKINNNYHTILSDGDTISTQTNTFQFGDNLIATPSETNPNVIIVKATGVLSNEAVTKFVNLSDIDVGYSGNAGKMLIINDDETGITVDNAPVMADYMKKVDYCKGDIEKVDNAIHADEADHATNADQAGQAQNAKISENSVLLDSAPLKNDEQGYTIWTSDKIVSNTSAQIQAEGISVLHGTSVPSNSLGKDGDIYILIEE